MFSRRIYSYSNRLFKQIQKYKVPMANVASGAGIIDSFYDFVSGKLAENHVSYFKSRLTPTQLAEMQSSVEKSNEYKEQCKEEIRMSFRLD